MHSDSAVEFTRMASWEEACDASLGYQDSNLVEHLRIQLESSPPWLNNTNPSRLVDSRLIEFLAAFLLSLKNQERSELLSVIDFGGGNGYFGAFIRSLLPNTNVKWTVLESAEIASAYNSVPHPDWLDWKCSNQQDTLTCDIFVASCSLNYVADPWKVLQIASQQSRHQILMRLPLLTDYSHHVPVVQTPTGDGPYRNARASWPAWWFSKNEFDDFLHQLGMEVYRWRTPEESWMFEGRVVALEGRLVKSTA